MYTGEADHSLTAEFVERVGVPVVASGDITSRARAQAVLATTGAAAVMVGRQRRATRGCCRRSSRAIRPEPTREEVVAELMLFMRETVRELGEQRATSFLKKFYGWYLGSGRFPRQFKSELTQLPTIADVEQRLLIAAPGAAELLGAAGGRAARRTRSSSSCRSPSTAAVDGPPARLLEAEVRDPLDATSRLGAPGGEARGQARARPVAQCASEGVGSPYLSVLTTSATEATITTAAMSIAAVSSSERSHQPSSTATTGLTNA